MSSEGAFVSARAFPTAFKAADLLMTAIPVIAIKRKSNVTDWERM
jgi:hypothetical protein